MRIVLLEPILFDPGNVAGFLMCKICMTYVFMATMLYFQDANTSLRKFSFPRDHVMCFYCMPCTGECRTVEPNGERLDRDWESNTNWVKHTHTHTRTHMYAHTHPPNTCTHHHTRMRVTTHTHQCACTHTHTEREGCIGCVLLLFHLIDQHLKIPCSKFSKSSVWSKQYRKHWQIGVGVCNYINGYWINVGKIGQQLVCMCVCVRVCTHACACLCASVLVCVWFSTCVV